MWHTVRGHGALPRQRQGPAKPARDPFVASQVGGVVDALADIHLIPGRIKGIAVLGASFGYQARLQLVPRCCDCPPGRAGAGLGLEVPERAVWRWHGPEAFLPATLPSGCFHVGVLVLVLAGIRFVCVPEQSEQERARA